nr:MAG TPA: hypothetical protein [Bacteriophage sp.]
MPVFGGSFRVFLVRGQCFRKFPQNHLFDITVS